MLSAFITIITFNLIDNKILPFVAVFCLILTVIPGNVYSLSLLQQAFIAHSFSFLFLCLLLPVTTSLLSSVSIRS